MIVLDASVVVEMLMNSPLAEFIRQDLAQRDDVLIVPHLLDIEVAGALRSLAAAHRIDSFRAAQALEDLAILPAERFAHAPLLERIWELRHNFTPYDATYIALAEENDALLYTSDQKLSRGHRARVVVIRG